MFFKFGGEQKNKTTGTRHQLPTTTKNTNANLKNGKWKTSNNNNAATKKTHQQVVALPLYRGHLATFSVGPRLNTPTRTHACTHTHIILAHVTRAHTCAQGCLVSRVFVSRIAALAAAGARRGRAERGDEATALAQPRRREAIHKLHRANAARSSQKQGLVLFAIL